MGKDIDNIRFRASNRLFQNSSAVVVEYYDCIQLSWFVFLSFLQKMENLKDRFDVDLIENLTLSELLSFYYNREYINPCVELWKGDEKPIDELNHFLEDQMNASDIFFDVQMGTTMVRMIQNMIVNRLVEKVYVYVPQLNEYIKNDIHFKFGEKVSIISGDFQEAIAPLNKDATYIFSDILKVMDLIESDRLNYSAVMIPYEYRYNYTDSKRDKYLIDMKELEKDHIFKWAVYHLS